MKQFNSILIIILLFSMGIEANAQRPSFNKSKDMLLANFDLKPDEDDVMAAAALSSMLRHSDLAGVNYLAVAGAFGEQGGLFIPTAIPAYHKLFGKENEGWTNAYKDWPASVNRAKRRVKVVLDNGGKVFVAEAGQSDFTHDVMKGLIDDGMAAGIIKKNVIVVQHSEWNERHTNEDKFEWIDKNTIYEKIDDGNSSNNKTPGYRNKNRKWLNRAKSNSNPNKFAKEIWIEADKICDEFPASYENPAIEEGGVDFSDAVEFWWIFEIGNKANTLAKFWDRYVTNSNGTIDGPSPGSGNDGGACEFADDNGLLIMEAESTKTGLGKWIVEKNVNGHTGSGHIEFTGNGSNGGPATSPLKYTFKINKGGNYRLNIRCHKQLDGAPGDKNNDGYVRVEGDYSAGTGNKAAATVDLKKNTKIFGGSPTGWGWATQLDVNNKIKKFPIYNFKAGETYTLILSGRSIKWNVDRIVFYHSSVSQSDARNASKAETKGNCDGGGNGGGNNNGNTVTLSPINDAYLQGTRGFNNTFVRIEEGKRAGYLMFDLSKVEGAIIGAELKMTVNGDGGAGTIDVEKGSASSWSETNLTMASKPTAKELLGSLNSTYTIGNTYTWTLDGSKIDTGGNFSMLLTQKGGNDVAFASKENGNGSNAPKLILKVSKNATSKSALSAEEDTDMGVVVFPNPISGSAFKLSLNLEKDEDLGIKIFDSAGKVLHTQAYTSTVAGKQNIQVNMKNATTGRGGVYFLMVSSQKQQEVIKMMVK